MLEKTKTGINQISVMITPAYLIFKTLRPKQWTKNFFIFAGILFSQNLFNLPLLYKSTLAFIIFCLLTGSIYIINDLVDIEQDRLHPEKCKRPLASGSLKSSSAIIAVSVLIFFLLVASYYLGISFFIVAFAYFLLQVAYSLLFKRIVILDVFAIAAGFVLRVVAGAVVIDIKVSSWLLICTILLALFIGLSKRRHELILLEQEAKEHRKVLDEYNFRVLDQMISVVTASTVVTYALYAMSEETVKKFGTENLVFTIPFVLYGIFRYLYLVYSKNSGGSPENILISDKPLIINVILWVASIMFILYGGNFK